MASRSHSIPIQDTPPPPRFHSCSNALERGPVNGPWEVFLTRTVNAYVHVYENRVLTHCGCAGSDGQGVMEDVKRDIHVYMYSKVNVLYMKTEYMYLLAVVVQVQ